MAAEERDSGAGLSLRRASRMEDDFGVEARSCFGNEFWSMNSSGALRQAGAFLMNRSKAECFAAGLLHAAHHAVMLAVSSAAGREIRLGIRGKQRRNHHPDEEHQHRVCDRAAHGIAVIIPQINLGM